MEYVYAALMLHKLKKDITEKNLTAVVKASGGEVNEAQVKSLVASLADVNIEEAIKAAPVAVATAPTAAATQEGGESKKEGKKDDVIQERPYKPHIEDVMEYCSLEEVAEFLKDDPELSDWERFDLYYDERERRKPKEKGLTYNQLLKQSGIKPVKKK